MASEELPEPVEEKKAFHEGIDLHAVNNFVSTENAKEKMEIKSSVVDGIIGNEDVDLVKEETEVPSKLSTSTEPNLIITEKPEISEKCTENLEAELIEHEENSSPIEEQSTQEKINGETENGLHLTQFTEECSPEVIKGNEVPANGTSFLSEEIQEKSDSEPSKIEKIDSEEVTKEDAPQNQEEVEIPVREARQNPEEDLTREFEIPSSTTPVVTEEISEEAKGNNEILEEVQQEEMHQNDAAKENLTEEKKCRDATEDESRGVSEIITGEETIPEMISEEVKPTEDTIGIDEKNETTESNKAENAVDKILNSTINEETGTINESLEHISDESTLETVVSRDVTPEFEIKDSQKALSAKTDNMNTEKIEDEDEAKNSEEVEPSESTAAPIKVEEATPNDCEDEKPEGDDKLKHIETNDEQEVHSFLVTEGKLEESKPSTSEEILSSDRYTIETKSVEEPEEGEKDVAPNELTEPSNNTEASTDAEIPRKKTELLSENAVSSVLTKSEEVLPETPSESTVLSEMEIENMEHKLIDSEKDNTEAENSHEPNEISDKDDIETSTSEDQIKEDEIVDTNEPDNVEQNFEADDKQEESLPGDIVNETTHSIQKEEVLSAKEESIKNEITEEKQPSTDDDKIVFESLETDNEPDVHEKLITSDMNKEDSPENSVAEGNSDDILLQDNETVPQLESTSEIQSNKENEMVKEQCVQDKSEEHITEVEGSTEVTEVPEKVQNSTSERSYEQDQLIPEKATEQDDFQTASIDSNIETEKPQMGDTSNQEAVEDNLIPQTDDKSELEVKPEKRTEEESLTNKEIPQSLEVVEEPCIITDNKEELSEEGSTIVQEESSSEPSITTIQQDQQSEESDTKTTEANQATDDISVAKGLDVSTPLITSIEETDEISINKAEDTITREENIVVEAPNDEAQVAEKLEESIAEITESTNPSETTEVERSQSETVVPETENLEVTPNDRLEDESNPTAIDAKSAESENITEESTEQEELSIEPSNTREFQIDQTEIAAEEDQQSQDSSVKASVPDQATAEVSEMGNSEVDAEPGASVEQTKEEAVGKEESVVLQQEDVAVKMPEEEAEIEAENEKHIIEEEIPEVTNLSKVTDGEFTQSETVPPEKENLEVIPNEKLEDENDPTAIDAKSAELENTTDEPCEEKEVLIEPSNTRGLQIDQEEIIAEPDQLSNESDVKPTEPDQATDEVSAVENLDVNSTVKSSVEEIEKESVAKEESVVLQEEDAAVEMPKEESENEKHIEEQVSEIANPSEVTEILDAISNEELGDEIKLDLSDTKSAEFENTTDEPTKEKEVSTEPSNTRELQTDHQMKIIAEQDQPSKESEGKPSEQDQATEEVSTVTVENSDVDATVSATAEEIGHESAAKEENVVLQEEVAVDMPKEEAAHEVHTEEEIPQVVTPSEINEDQLVETETETVGPEASDEKFEGEVKLTETELKADQMDKSPDELIEEKPSASVSLSGEEIHEKGEESEVLPERAGEQELEGENIDVEVPKEGTGRSIEAAEEPCDKHIEGEILRTADPEVNNVTEEQLKVELTEREVDPQIFETQSESPDIEKATEESASVEEKLDALSLVPGEAQIEETESSVLPQVETNEEEISQIVPSTEITDKQSVESERLHPETKQLEIVSNEKLKDESEITENVLNLAQMESPSDELIEENLNASLSGSVKQVNERFEDSEEVMLESVGEQVQGEKTNAEMPKEETGQEIEEADAPCDKHLEGEIHRTLDPEIAYAAEGSNAILTEDEVDSQKFVTKTELPEQEEKTEESTSLEEKSDATASLLPGEGQIEVETSDVPQSTTESVTVPEEEISHEVVTSEEPVGQVQDIAGEITKFADPEISEVAVQSNIMLNEEEVGTEKLVNEIELPDLGSATEKSALVEENSGDGANAIPGEGKFEEREIVNEETSVAPLSDIESVTVPEEKVPQEIETYDEPSDKHIVGEHLENDPSTDIQEDKGEQGQTTSSPVEQPNSENTGTEMESALLEKTNGEIDVKENHDEAGLTSSFVEEGDIMSQTDNGSETVPVVVQMHAEDQVAKEHTERDINSIEFLKTAEHKMAVDEFNEHTEDTVRNSIEQNKVVQEETNQSEEPEQDFSFIVSSFLINKVLSEENQKVDDGTQQNNASTYIPKTLHDENVLEVTATNDPETRDEEVPYATSSREDLKPEQQQEEENEVKEVEENEVKEDGVEQDYLPFSRFLMDKILRQEETKNPGKEVEAIGETDKHVISDDGIQVQEKIEENSNLVAEPQQKGEMPFIFDELTTDFEKGETPNKEVANTCVGTGVISTQEKIEENTAVEELPKQEGEGSHSPIELARDVEKEEKPAEKAPESIKDENKTLVSDVGFSSLETNEEENSSFVVVAEQEGENNISPVEAIRDVEKEDKSIEQNDGLVSNEGIPVIEKIEENTGEVAIPEQGENILYPVEVVRDCEDDKSAEKDETIVSKVTSLAEDAEDLAYREPSKDLVEETSVNAHEISNPEKVIEENKIVVMPKEEEHKNEVIADEETLKDVKNVEDNYVFVEHEVSQFEEPKEILEEKVADEVPDAAIPNLEKKQTDLLPELHNEERSLVGQGEVTEKGMDNSAVNCQEIEKSLSDVPKVPMVTEIVKEPVGNETDLIHGEEQIKEVAGTVVESLENKSQEKPSEVEATKMEKKSEENKDEEHEEEEEEEEEESHQDRETEISSRDLTVKSESKETEMKSAQKKSHNILLGVGSKVKHSFTKVKKAFTGKSKSASPTAK